MNDDLQENIDNILWEFIRGDLSTTEFEQIVYNDKKFENILEANYYLHLLEHDFRDKNSTEDLKLELKEYMLQKKPMECQCISI